MPFYHKSSRIASKEEVRNLVMGIMQKNNTPEKHSKALRKVKRLTTLRPEQLLRKMTI